MDALIGMLMVGFVLGIMAVSFAWLLEHCGITGKEKQKKDNGGKKDNKLHINCPECGRPLKGATREMIGDIGICSKCKVEFVIEPNQ